MKAMVFAAGLGTRLRPLTNDRPKALVTVAGRTLLELTLSRLRAQVGRGDPGEKHGPERGPDGRWRDGGAHLCRYGLGGCIGLLGGQASLLDLEVCSIAGGVHVL